MSRWKNLPASLMEIGKLSSLPIILLRAIQGNNYDFTLQPEIILNRSNTHSNRGEGREQKNRRSIEDVETHSQLFRREILLWELPFPAKWGYFLDNKKKKKRRERLPSLSTVIQLPTSSKRKTTNPRVTVATNYMALVSSTDSIGMFREERSSATRFGLNPIPRRKWNSTRSFPRPDEDPSIMTFTQLGMESREDRSMPENFEFDAQKYLVTQISGFLKLWEHESNGFGTSSLVEYR